MKIFKIEAENPLLGHFIEEFLKPDEAAAIVLQLLVSGYNCWHIKIDHIEFTEEGQV